jgi:hypothetical protein
MTAIHPKAHEFRHQYFDLEEPIRDLYYMAALTWALVEESGFGAGEHEARIIDAKLRPASREGIIMNAIHCMRSMSHELLEKYHLGFEKGGEST